MHTQKHPVDILYSPRASLDSSERGSQVYCSGLVTRGELGSSQKHSRPCFVASTPNLLSLRNARHCSNRVEEILPLRLTGMPQVVTREHRLGYVGSYELATTGRQEAKLVADGYVWMRRGGGGRYRTECGVRILPWSYSAVSFLTDSRARPTHYRLVRASNSTVP
eukprot:1365738-Pyramimonas_sp.AAC.1